MQTFNVSLGMPRRVDIAIWGREAIYFAKRKLPRARRIAPFPRDKRAARNGWSALRKTDRRASPLASKRAAKASWQLGEHPIGRRTVIRAFRENTGTRCSVCIHCAFSVLLTRTNPGCRSNLLFYVPSVSPGLLRRPIPLLTLSQLSPIRLSPIPAANCET